MKGPLPRNEAARLEALRHYQILDTEPEAAFDDLTRLAAQLCGTPIALVSLVDESRQWFKSKVGLEVAETPRDLAFCAYTILQPDEVLLVPDTLADERFATNPLVTSAPYIRFYAGVPLITPQGHALGTLCVIDQVPRDLSQDQLAGLRTLGRQVMTQLQLRRHLVELERATTVELKQVEQALHLSEQRFWSTFEHAAAGMAMTDLDGRFLEVNPSFCNYLGYTKAELLQLNFAEVIHPQSLQEASHQFQQAREGNRQSIDMDTAYLRKNGTTVWSHTTAAWVFDDGQKPLSCVAVIQDITERKRAEEALQLAHNQLEARVQERTADLAKANEELQAEMSERKRAEEDRDRFFTLSLDMLCVATLEGYFIDLNPAWEKTLGYSLAELQSSSFLHFVHSEDQAATVAELEKLTTSAPTIDFENRYRCKDGSYRWLAWRSIALVEKGLAYAIARDVTERHQAESALRQQTERERLVAAIGHRIHRSFNLEEILNTTVTEVRQFLQTDRVFIYRFESDWSGIVMVESVVEPWTPICGSRIEDHCFSGTYAQPYKQGRIQATADIYAAGLSQCHIDLLTPFQVRANLVVPILQGERLWGLLIANHCAAPREWQPLEINLLKQLATQLGIAIQQAELYQQTQVELAERKQAEQKMHEQATLLDVATDAIFVRNLENVILYWNQGAEQLYGWQADEAVGKNASELLNREAASQLEAALKSVIAEGEWQGELHKFTKANKEVIVASRWTLVEDEAGNPKSILTVDTDITEKNQLEAQFLRAQRLESVGTLAGGIAHDLNNILTPILAVAQLLPLKFPDADEQSQRMLEILETNTKRGAEIVKQVLSFARGVEGQRITLQARHLIKEVQQIAKQTFPKSIEIFLDVPSDLWPISGDATQIHQVLMNLCVNARDAMPEGGTLNIAAENFFIDAHYARMTLDAQVGPCIVLTVSDTGVGMPPEVMDRIFEPFFTTKELGKGTGLGLATVIGIIKSHGGFVKVASEVGKGTQFKVFLPALSEAEVPTVEALELPLGHGELILVVDDEAAIQEITQTTLEAYSYRVITASDGIEAIALYAQHKDEISGVLMDMIMPSMGGATAIQTLRKMNPQVKIIAVSGLITTEQLRQTAGIEAFLSKPYTAQELLQTLHQVL